MNKRNKLIKRISWLLVFSMAIGLLVGCGQKNDDKSEDSEKELSVGYEDDFFGDNEEDDFFDDYVDESVIRENGSLPNDVEQLTDAEFSYYLGIVIKALKELDTETLKEYYKVEEKEGDSWVDDLMNAYRNYGDIECLELIKKNESMRTLWEDTIGKSIFLSDSGYVVYKDTEYLYYKWYNDQIAQGKTLPYSTSSLSTEEILTIYEEYNKDIPYNVSSSFNGAVCFVEEGRIYFKVDMVLTLISGNSIMSYEPDENGEFSSGEYAALAFGGTHYLEDEIATDGVNDLRDIALSGDLNKVVEHFDSRTEYDLNTMDDYKGEKYRNYYKNDIMRAKAQQWMDENVKVFNGGSNVYFYVPVNMEETYPFYSISEEERTLLGDVTIMTDIIMYEESGDEYDFFPYSNLADRMEEYHVFEQ